MATPTIPVVNASNVVQVIAAPNSNGQAPMASSRPVVIASDQPAIGVQPAYLPPTPYTPGTAFDARVYGSVTFDCTVAATGAYNIQRSPDAVAWPEASNMTGIDLNFNPITTFGLSANSGVALRGGAWVMLTAGTGGTFYVSASQ